MTRKLIVALAAIVWGALAYGQGVAPEGSVRVVREHLDYDINADGTGYVIAELALSPTIRNAVNMIGQRTIEYQEGMTSIELLEAYTLKSDGKRIDVAADRIVTQVPPAYANAPIYTDMKVKRIIFPDLSVGDQVVYRYKRVYETPLFPGQFFDGQVFARSLRHDDVRVTIKHPIGYLMQFHTRDMQEQPRSSTATHTVREWRYSSDSVVPDEPGAVSNYDRDPVFEVSSFKDWAEIARAYDARAKDKATPSPAIKKMAEEITAKAKGKRAQAEAIYAWVTNNIRYVAVYLGAGGFVPHSADSILASRYGDCKDYVTIMEALLAAKGIASTPVLIDAANRFALPAIPTPAAFNHAIVYLPELKLYLDATARLLRFGELSTLEANKTVLHARGFSGLLQTPPVPAASRTFTTQSTLELTAGGGLTGVTTVNVTGSLAPELQAALTPMEDPAISKQISQALLNFEGFTGSATFTRTAPLANAQAAYQASFAVSAWINLPGPGAVRLPSGLLAANSVRQTAIQLLNNSSQKLDRFCLPIIFEESSSVQLSSFVAPAQLPKDAQVANALASYSATYSRDGTQVRVVRRLELKPATTVCTPQDWQALREIALQVQRDTAAQMTYQ